MGRVSLCLGRHCFSSHGLILWWNFYTSNPQLTNNLWLVFYGKKSKKKSKSKSKWPTQKFNIFQNCQFSIFFTKISWFGPWVSSQWCRKVKNIGGATSKGWAESAPHGWNRVNWSAKYWGGPVAPLAPPVPAPLSRIELIPWLEKSWIDWCEGHWKFCLIHRWIIL